MEGHRRYRTADRAKKNRNKDSTPPNGMKKMQKQESKEGEEITQPERHRKTEQSTEMSTGTPRRRIDASSPAVEFS